MRLYFRLLCKLIDRKKDRLQRSKFSLSLNIGGFIIIASRHNSNVAGHFTPGAHTIAETIEFVSTDTDHSLDTGLPFEINRDRCGMGYRIQFHPSAMGSVSNVLERANERSGDIFGQASFCAACGASLVLMAKFCPRCGKKAKPA